MNNKMMIISMIFIVTTLSASPDHYIPDSLLSSWERIAGDGLKLEDQARQFYALKYELNNCSFPEWFLGIEGYNPYEVLFFGNPSMSTVKDFEKNIYQAIQEMKHSDSLMTQKKLHHMVKLFLVFLEECGNKLKNHDLILFNTPAIQWLEYRGSNGNYNFDIDDQVQLCAHIITILECIEHHYSSIVLIA